MRSFFSSRLFSVLLWAIMINIFSSPLCCSSDLSVSCYSCNAHDLETGCNKGHCKGDFCIDRYETDQKGTTILSRGCYTRTVGLKSEFTSSDCTSIKFENSYKSICGCASRDFCYSGGIQKENRTGDVHCIIGEKSGQQAINQGDRCLTWDNKYQGRVNDANTLPLTIFGVPRPEDEWFEYKGSRIDACSRNYCNGQIIELLASSSNQIQCFNDSANSTVSNTCFGSACALRIFSNQERGMRESYEQSCVHESNNEPAVFCEELKTGTRTETNCICKTDHCNKDLETAIESIESKRKCYKCQVTSASEGCTSSDLCEGQMCIDEKKGKNLFRGCYSVLAGDPVPLFRGTSCSGILSGEDDSYSYCLCNENDKCRNGGFLEVNSSEKKIECNARSGVCKGDQCLSGSLQACQIFGTPAASFPVKFPQLRNVTECVKNDDGRICSCTSRDCNEKTNTFSNDLNEIDCLTDSGVCKGSACYIEERSLYGVLNAKLGCLKQTGVNSPTQFCIRKQFSYGNVTECVCAQPMCNKNVDTAIYAINNPPTTTTAFTTLQPSTTEQKTTSSESAPTTERTGTPSTTYTSAQTSTQLTTEDTITFAPTTTAQQENTTNQPSISTEIATTEHANTNRTTKAATTLAPTTITQLETTTHQPSLPTSHSTVGATTEQASTTINSEATTTSFDQTTFTQQETTAQQSSISTHSTEGVTTQQASTTTGSEATTTSFEQTTFSQQATTTFQPSFSTEDATTEQASTNHTTKATSTFVPTTSTQAETTTSQPSASTSYSSKVPTTEGTGTYSTTMEPTTASTSGGATSTSETTEGPTSYSTAEFTTSEVSEETHGITDTTSTSAAVTTSTTFISSSSSSTSMFETSTVTSETETEVSGTTDSATTEPSSAAPTQTLIPSSTTPSTTTTTTEWHCSGKSTVRSALMLLLTVTVVTIVITNLWKQ